MLVKQLIVRGMKVTSVVVASLLASSSIGEQVRLLDVEDARTIVEHIPVFLKAASSAAPSGATLGIEEVVAFQVRT